MSGERLPSPDWQVRRALEVARAAGEPFAFAWMLAVHGHVCDDYRSARSATVKPHPQAPTAGPPGLRPSEPPASTKAGRKRCAGCRYVEVDPAGGPATCARHDHPVFAGVLWPHRTEDRNEWQASLGVKPHTEDDSPMTLAATVSEWARCYRGDPSPVALVLSAIRYQGQQAALERADDERGHVAA